MVAGLSLFVVVILIVCFLSARGETNVKNGF